MFERGGLDPGCFARARLSTDGWKVAQYLAAALEHSKSDMAELLRVLGGYDDQDHQLPDLRCREPQRP